MLDVLENGTKIEPIGGPREYAGGQDARMVQAIFPLKEYFEIDVLSGDYIGIGLSPVEPKRPNYEEVQSHDRSHLLLIKMTLK